MHCDSCSRWITCRKTVYEDGEEIVNFRAPDGKGQCDHLHIETAADFGCTAFVEGGHVEITRKSGAPWQNWKYGPCPECKGVGCFMVEMRPACGHCAGLGKVRHYDDGYIADKSWDHPKEKEIKRRMKEAGFSEDDRNNQGQVLAQVKRRSEGVLEGGSV